MLLEKIEKHKTLIFLTVFSILFAFHTSKNWLQDGCIVTASDFEIFRSIGQVIHLQLINYHWIYPITFASAHGATLFLYSSIPFLIPLIFTPVFSYNTSLLITHILFYSLAPVSMYILLKNTTKNEFVSLLISLYFLISPALNAQYTVYGSYHTLIALPLFFLGINSLLQYEKTKTRKNAILFALYSFLLAAVHMSTFPFYFIFAFCYAAIKKEKKILIILFLATTASAYYITPVVAQQLTTISNTEAATYKGDFIGNFNGLFFKKHTTYTTAMDFNYRPYLILSATILILISLIKKENNSYKISIRHLTSKIPLWILVLYITVMLRIGTHGYHSLLPLCFDRYGLFAQISFLLIIGVILSKTRISLPIYLIVTSILLLISNDNARVFAALIMIIPASYLLLSYIRPKFDSDIRGKIDVSKIKIKDTIIMIALILALFYPLTGNVFASNTSPRIWCSHIPHISEIITEKDIYRDIMESHTAITTLTKAKRANSIGATDKSGIDLKLSLGLNDNRTYELLKKEGTTKIIIAIFSPDFKEKYAHLFKWFGEPTVIQGTRRGQPQYYLIFNTGFTSERDYDMKIITPTTLEITKNPKVDEQMIHLLYHPWWKVEGRKATLGEDEDGFTVIKNAQAISKLRIKWDYKYFYLGWLITILSIILLICLIKNDPKDQTTKNDAQPININRKRKHKHPKKQKNRNRK